MEYITGRTEFTFKNSAICLGKFDGIHKGHMKLIEKTLEFKAKDYVTIMFTFDYHPLNLFSEREISLLYTEDEKKTKLQKKGLDILLAYPFTKETASMLPEYFVKNILIDKLGAKVIIVGSDFHFGKERKGNISLLKTLSEQYNFQLIVCDKVKSGSIEISSTLIRNEINKGNIETANELLGHKFTISGEVLHGRKIGRTLGIPTTNIIPPPDKLLPPNGVYISKTIINNHHYSGITNIGFKPTVGAEPIKGVETYMFDYNEDLYGKIIEIELYSFVRKECKYKNIEELKTQIQKDINFGKSYNFI